MNFRELVKRLHPDSNGGDTSRVDEFRQLMESRKRLCACGCGHKIYKNRARYYTQLCALRHRYYHRSLAAILLLLTVGLSLPEVPKKRERLHSPRGMELYAATPMTVVLPPKSYVLRWDYRLPLPRPGVEFDIETKVDFSSDWVKLGSTNSNVWPITADRAQAFYRVGAHRK